MSQVAMDSYLHKTSFLPSNVYHFLNSTDYFISTASLYVVNLNQISGGCHTITHIRWSYDHCWGYC